MDIPRKSAARNRRLRRILYIIIVMAVVVGGTLGLRRLQPAAQSVDGAGLYSGTVKRGQMLRNVRGLGTLVPEETRWIAPVTSGRVEKRHVQPGAIVTPDTILVELSNPDLEQTALEAESNYKAAEAELVNQTVQLRSGILSQQANIGNVRSQYNQAKLQADSYGVLVKEGLYAEMQYKLLRVQADEASSRLKLEEERLQNSIDAMKSQLSVQQSRVEQLRALYELRRKQVEQLKVRAGVNGVLQILTAQAEVGQSVSPGNNLARVADPRRLKAEVKIQETQAKDIQLGQKAEIDTRSGIIPGHVIRIDPSSQQGTRTVDVALDGELPKGAVPDMNVDGTIELERLENVLYMDRPAFGQENSTVGIFKYTPDGKEANLVTVKLGRTSVNLIEILEGLQVGDKVILSDMTQHDSQKRVRIN
jgi:HlyD family secretion protein